MHFVEDPKTRFDLAIECGNLEVAIETAKTLNDPDCWEMLANEALSQGSFLVVEKCFQQMKSLDKLSFLYLLSGNPSKMQKLQKLVQPIGKFQNSLVLGDPRARVEVLKDCGQGTLNKFNFKMLWLIIVLRCMV